MQASAQPSVLTLAEHSGEWILRDERNLLYVAPDRTSALDHARQLARLRAPSSLYVHDEPPGILIHWRFDTDGRTAVHARSSHSALHFSA